MKVEVLHHESYEKGSVIAFIDCKVTYADNKEEIYRNLSVLEKEGNKWISIGNVKRGERWLPRYERQPPLKEVFIECLKAYEEFRENSFNQCDEPDCPSETPF